MRYTRDIYIYRQSPIIYAPPRIKVSATLVSVHHFRAFNNGEPPFAYLYRTLTRLYSLRKFATSSNSSKSRKGRMPPVRPTFSSHVSGLLTELPEARIKKIASKVPGGKMQTKFKVRCSRYLYTLSIDDPEKADKLQQSLPPGVL